MFKQLALAACLLLLATPAWAQQNTKVIVDLTSLDTRTRDAVIDQMKADAPKTVIQNITPDEAQKWAATGKGIGDAIAAAAKALNTGVNDFIKTPAGIMVVWAIFMYLFGGTVLHVVLGPIVWAILGFVIWRSARIWLQPNIRTLKDGTTIDKTFEWRSSDAKCFCGAAHAVAFILLTLAMLGIIFH